MLNMIQKEKFNFLFLFILIGVITSLVSALLFHNQINHAYEQHKYFINSDFNFVYETVDKVNENSYKYFDNHKMFYKEDGLITKLNVSTLMELDVNYNYDNFITDKNILQGLKENLGINEVIINLVTSEKYSLNINDSIYSKNNYDQQIYEFKIVGIMNNLYSLNKYEFSSSLGFLILGYNKQEEENNNFKYLNFSNEDPSNIIINNETSLHKLYDVSKNIRKTKVTLSLFLVIILVINIISYFAVFLIPLSDLSNYFKRLTLAGNIKKTEKIIAVRVLLLLSISIILISIFYMIIKFIVGFKFLTLIYVLIISIQVITSLLVFLYERFIKVRKGLLL